MSVYQIKIKSSFLFFFTYSTLYIYICGRNLISHCAPLNKCSTEQKKNLPAPHYKAVVDKIGSSLELTDEQWDKLRRKRVGHLSRLFPYISTPNSAT